MVKNRNIALCIILSLVTCGIYGLYWFVCLTDDTNTISGEPGTSGVVALVLTIVTCGIYGIYWFIVLSNDTNTVSNAENATSGGVAFVLRRRTLLDSFHFWWNYRLCSDSE